MRPVLDGDALEPCSARAGALVSMGSAGRPSGRRVDRRLESRDGAEPGRSCVGRPGGGPRHVAFMGPQIDRGAMAVADQPNPNDLQQKYRQFLDLLPLTITLAGLPTSEGRLYSEDQIEARGITIRAAYRVARTVAKECLGGS